MYSCWTYCCNHCRISLQATLARLCLSWIFFCVWSATSFFYVCLWNNENNAHFLLKARMLGVVHYFLLQYLLSLIYEILWKKNNICLKGSSTHQNFILWIDRDSSLKYDSKINIGFQLLYMIFFCIFQWNR